MRIRDWSSDVCSSDLALAPQGPADTSTIAHDAGHGFAYLPLEHRPPRDERELARFLDQRIASTGHFDHPAKPRSEEHTSELQSLMRISYAVFCLKKKNKQQLTTTHTIHAPVQNKQKNNTQQDNIYQAI